MKNLRTAVIRLAHENPDLRSDLLPLLRTAATPQHIFKVLQRLGKAAGLGPFEMSHIPHMEYKWRGGRDPQINLIWRAKTAVIRQGRGHTPLDKFVLSGVEDRVFISDVLQFLKKQGAYAIPKAPRRKGPKIPKTTYF